MTCLLVSEWGWQRRRSHTDTQKAPDTEQMLMKGERGSEPSKNRGWCVRVHPRWPLPAGVVVCTRGTPREVNTVNKNQLHCLPREMITATLSKTRACAPGRAAPLPQPVCRGSPAALALAHCSASELATCPPPAFRLLTLKTCLQGPVSRVQTLFKCLF